MGDCQKKKLGKWKNSRKQCNVKRSNRRLKVLRLGESLFCFFANVTWKMRLLFAKNAGTLHGSPPWVRKSSLKSSSPPRTSYSSDFSVGRWCRSPCTKFPFNVFAQSIKRRTTIEYRKVVKQSWERESGVSIPITLELQSLPVHREKINIGEC